MSKQSKQNRDHYTQRGRLTPDDAARERVKQVNVGSTRRLEGRPHSEAKATPRGRAETDPADREENETNEDEEESPEERSE